MQHLLRDLLLVVVVLAVLAIQTSAFTRLPTRTLSSTSQLLNKLKDESAPDNETEQQMRERMKRKARKMMFNEDGVAYAPWLTRQVDEDAIVEDLIRKERKEKGLSPLAATKSKTVMERGEIESSEGLRWRMNSDQVELAWVTGGESNNKGYIVEKRPSYGGEFQEVASFKEVSQLASKGVAGGRYRYTDPSTTPGSWVYRVQDCDNAGKKTVLCQSFVEVQTEVRTVYVNQLYDAKVIEYRTDLYSFLVCRVSPSLSPRSPSVSASLCLVSWPLGTLSTRHTKLQNV